jgi:hypothetical protein
MTQDTHATLIADLVKALEFYRDNWRRNMIGTGEHGSTFCFEEPTQALNDDGVAVAIAALARAKQLDLYRAQLWGKGTILTLQAESWVIPLRPTSGDANG